MIFKENEYLYIGDTCYLDIWQEIVVKDGLKISLSRLQFRILYYLASKMHHVIQYEELINYAWGINSFVTKDQLYVYINRIRN